MAIRLRFDLDGYVYCGSPYLYGETSCDARDCEERSRCVTRHDETPVLPPGWVTGRTKRNVTRAYCPQHKHMLRKSAITQPNG